MTFTKSALSLFVKPYKIFYSLCTLIRKDDTPKIYSNLYTIYNSTY